MTRLSGVIAATPTPLHADLRIDTERLVAHCGWLLDAGGCNGVNLLGTTGEATSFSVEQRIAAMRAIAVSGLPLDRIMVGTGAAALADAVALTRAAGDLGFAGALLLPPFYYKGMDAASLAATVAQIVTDSGADGLRVYLYHIPQNTGVPFPIEVIARLRDMLPDTLAGLKDSSGDMPYARSVSAAFPGFDVFPSSEASLTEWRTSGFAGCISATTNLTGVLSRTAFEQPETTAGLRAAAAAAAIRSVLGSFPLMAAIKAALARVTADDAWNRLMPPLRPLHDDERGMLFARLAETEFAAQHAVPQN